LRSKQQAKTEQQQQPIRGMHLIKIKVKNNVRKNEKRFIGKGLWLKIIRARPFHIDSVAKKMLLEGKVENLISKLFK